MILITGAAGKTGRALLRRLSACAEPVRVLVRRAEQADVLLQAGAAEAVTGDLRDPLILEQACQSVRAIYHIPPNMCVDEPEIAGRLIAAARAGGVGLLVYHSVMHPHIEEMPHHWGKLRVEELVFKSGLLYTILQPAAYMQNLLGYWDRMVNDGIYAVPYAPETRLGMVDLEDVAEVSAKVLCEAGHSGAIYELSGAEALSQNEVAEVASRVIGRPVRAEALDRAVWEASARAAGLGDFAARTLRQMFEYYERYGFWGNPNVLGWLLGRPPVTLADFLVREARSGGDH